MISIKRSPFHLLVISGLLLLVAASRVLQLSLAHRGLQNDEVWSVWQFLGPYTDYTRDTTWPPLYYILLDIWHKLVGLNPLVLRFLSVSFFMIGTACTYRVMRRLKDETAARFAILVYGAVALGFFISTQSRGYAQAYGLLPLTFWLTIRYFDHPKLQRAILLGLIMAALFYTTYSAIGAFLVLGIYTLVAYRQTIWRWWVPGIAAGFLAVPGILNIFSFSTGRLKILSEVKLPPLLTASASILQKDAGHTSAAWLALFVLATLLIVYNQRPPRLPALALLAWSGCLVLFYFLNPLLGFWDSVYLWFIGLGLMLWIAWGLSFLPRWGQTITTIVLIGIMFTPVPYGIFQNEPTSLGISFEWLAKNVQWGDVIVIDPQWSPYYCHCIDPEIFDYFKNLYFPQGIPVVSSPEGYRRVWYLKSVSYEDKSFEQRVETNRQASIFVGPPEVLFRLYEAPPDSVGVLFDNGMRFHGLELIDQTPGLLVRRANDSVRVRLWWSVDKPPAFDYSIGLHVYFNGHLAFQSDSAPQIVDAHLPSATSQWVPNQYYIEERELTVPRSAVTGQYPVYLVVYQWWDNMRINAAGLNQDELLPLTTLYVKAW